MKLMILRLLGRLGEYLRAVFVRGVADQIEALLPIAFDVVKKLSVDQTYVTGEEKRKVALEELKRFALAASIKASLSTLSFALELAVQKLKAETGR